MKHLVTNAGSSHNSVCVTEEGDCRSFVMVGGGSDGFIM
jgi:hypothetical protein